MSIVVIIVSSEKFLGLSLVQEKILALQVVVEAFTGSVTIFFQRLNIISNFSLAE